VSILCRWKWAETIACVSLELHDVQLYSSLIWVGTLKCGLVRLCDGDDDDDDGEDDDDDDDADDIHVRKVMESCVMRVAGPWHISTTSRFEYLLKPSGEVHTDMDVGEKLHANTFRRYRSCGMVLCVWMRNICM
jgi:hypothetical protein